MLAVCVAVGMVGIFALTAAAFSLEGEGNRSEFTVHRLSVCEISEQDAYFDRPGERDEWCCILVDVTADTWDLSPYTYTVDAFSVRTHGMLQNTNNAFVVLEESISYSHAEPKNFVLRVYLHVRPDVAAAELVSKLSFIAEGATKSIGVLQEDMKMYLPKLDMANQSNYQIIDNTKPDAKSASGFFSQFSSFSQT